MRQKAKHNIKLEFTNREQIDFKQIENINLNIFIFPYEPLGVHFLLPTHAIDQHY